ncbi:MAG: 2-dehydropantoate 2-reductase, partial [Balneolales bacterium]
MHSKTHIAIIGIGAVGGFYSGLLAGHYYQSDEVEVSFIVRGLNKKAIIENGLRIKAADFDQVVHPDNITDDPSTLRTIDYLICCTKSYGLEQSIEQVKPAIDSQTVILPLLNGVDSRETIEKLLPENEVWDGCAYIVSRLEEPGLIQTHSKMRSLNFGSDKGTAEKL